MRGYGEGGSNAPPDKWLCINQVVRDGRIAVLALQETHLTPERKDNLNALFGATMHILASYDPTNARGARGVAFALNKKLVNTDEATIVEIEAGRAAILAIPWSRGSKLRILNVYAPNDAGENQNFWERRADELDRRKYTRPDLLLGDFNIVEDAIDRLPPRQDAGEAVAQLQRFRIAAGLVDGWRTREPTRRVFTYLQTSTGSQSQIDRIYTSRAILRNANEWEEAGPGFPTDHRMVSVAIENLETPYMGRGRWAMPQSLLTDKPFLDTLHAMGTQLTKDLDLCGTRHTTTTPQKLFAQFKDEIRTAARTRAKQSVPRLEKQITDLKKDLRETLNAPERPDMKTHAAILQDKIAQLEIRRFGQKRRAVATNDWAKGETICKYWTRLNAAPMPSTTIPTLAEHGEGSETTYHKRSDQMARVAKCHYDGLQRDPDVCRITQKADTVEALRTTQVRLRQEDKGDLAKHVTEHEIEAAIRECATGKAPGLDGIPSEIWKIYLSRQKVDERKNKPTFNVLRALKTVFNDIERNGIEENTGFADGWICPIYKLKKDTREIVNYRPITLLNSDYKILTRILAMRLASVAHGLIHPDQAGFVPGRQIFDHIKLNKLMTSYAEAEEVNGMIIALDQEKAYDRIDHTYLWQTLDHLNFPQNFTNTVKRLYAAARSVVIVNGVMSEWFTIVRGVRQGDPMSCLLFNLAIEPLANMLRSSTLRGFKIPGTADRLVTKLFADDTTAYLHEEDSCEELMRILQKWCDASRAKFNDDKTEYIPIGTATFRRAVLSRSSDATVARTLPPNARLVKDGEAIRSLGAWIGNKVDGTTPWTAILETTQRRLTQWARRNPTMYGRKLVVGLEVGGRTRAQTMPEAVEKKFREMSLAFVWKGDKHPRISRETLYKPLNRGGLNLLDIEARNEAIDLMWLKEYLALGRSRPMWAYIADALIARTVLAADRTVEPAARINTFLQTWNINSRRGSALPEDLRRMVRTANKYGAGVDAPNPAKALKEALPIWYHMGRKEGRCTANCKSGKCLREKHGVVSVLDCVKIADRLAAEGRPSSGHRTRANCPCRPCKDDRDQKGCDNPHRCAAAAQKLLGNLQRIWAPEAGDHNDGLTLTKRRQETNVLARSMDGRIVFNPSITDRGELGNLFRIFVENANNPRTVAARRPPRPFQIVEEQVEVYTDGSCEKNGTADAAAGSGIWFGDGDARNVAAKVPGERHSNQTAELYAIAVAVAITPPFATLHIVTDSKYAIEGLTVHLTKWEERGWLGISNTDMIREVVARLRGRSAPTTFRWVKGHSGTPGNEAADELAKKGVDKGTDLVLPSPKMEYLRKGAALRTLTQKISYLGIEERQAKKERQATDRMLDIVQESLRAATHTSPTTAAIWRSLRAKDVPRKLRDFWWKTLHDALRIGKFWTHIPGYTERAVCAACGELETLEHILLECTAPGQELIWEEADYLLTRGGAPSFRRTLGTILGTPATTFEHANIPRWKGAQRLYRIVTMEATHLIWKMRCERVIQHDGNPEKWLTLREVSNRWACAINRRLAMDQSLTAARLQKGATPRATVLETWSTVLMQNRNLPEDWIGKPGVLVGTLRADRLHGVG